MKNEKAKYIVVASVIAAIYIVLTLVSAMFSLSSGPIQLRLSEALGVLACFTPAAIPGLFVGCIVANIFTGAVYLDVLFGSMATLIGAYFTYKLRKNKYLAVMAPVVSNTLIIPFILSYVYSFEGSIWYFAFTVFIGEFVSCGVLGLILYSLIEKNKNIF